MSAVDLCVREREREREREGGVEAVGLGKVYISIRRGRGWMDEDGCGVVWCGGGP